MHPPVIDDETFHRAGELLIARHGIRGGHKPQRSKHDYALRGLLFCGVCNRRMQGHWANAAPYYRCRFPSEYALANRVSHPLNVTLRQDALLDPLDTWLAAKFAPRYLPATIDELAAVPIVRHDAHAEEDEIDIKIAECGRKITSTGPRSTPAQTPPRSPGGSLRPKLNASGTRPCSARSRSSRPRG